VTFLLVVRGTDAFCTRTFPESTHDLTVLGEAGIGEEFSIRLGGRVTFHKIGGDLAYKDVDKVSEGRQVS
jgi:hypothetical protein